MRKGELCGLLWKDVDLGEGTVARLGHAKVPYETPRADISDLE